MTLALHRPPAIPLEIIAEHLTSQYGVEGVVTVVAAERDQNIRIQIGSGSLLLKISNLAEGSAVVEAQAAALQHIEKIDATLPVPRVMPTRTGAYMSTLEYANAQYPAVLLSWLEGELLVSAQPPYRNWREMGAMIARLGKALRGFVHPGVAQRSLIWDVMRADELMPHARALGDFWETPAMDVLLHFRDKQKPGLKSLRAQIIHGDVHPHNVLLTNGAISGIIDFGDMVNGPLILDLVAAIADCLHEETDIPTVFGQFVRGFDAVVPLEEPEIEALVPLVKVRLLAAAIISRMSAGQGVSSTHITSAYAQTCLASVDRLMTIETRAIEECRKTIGFSSTQSENVLQRRTAAMGPKPFLFYAKPLHMLRGQGVWLEADDGKRYLDCYNNVAHVGHAHPRVAEAVARQLRVLNTNTRYLTDQSIAYAEALKATLHPSLDTVILVNSGSEANDVAWRMANVLTGHTGALCMDFAYHGVTMATDALSPSNYPHGKWRFPHVRQLEAPDVYRGPIPASHPDVGEAYARMSDMAIADLEASGHGVSIAIMDLAFMTNGILEAPKGYVQGVADRVHKAGGLFIADEVQSGFGRMGSHLWGHGVHGVVPDFVTIGKPAGNGYPVGAIITRADIFAHFVAETGPFFSTFGGGNAACAAGLAVLGVMQDEGLLNNALVTGNKFRQELRILMQTHDIIGNVRGAGLATGVELVRDRASKEPAASETLRVLDLMRDAGVLIGRDGKHGNVLKLRPPLVFNEQNAMQVVETLGRVLAQL